MKFDIKQIRDKLLGINDSPQRIARGFGLGLFLGVLPGTGAIAAVVCAVVVRANKVSALAGALLVNTWINIVAFPIALGIGAFIFRIDPQQLQEKWSSLLKHFSWHSLFDSILLNALLAMLIGYIVIGLILGAIGYVITYHIVKRAHHLRQPQA